MSCLSGLIPTHAGKTRRRFRRSYVMGAHPHSRGENGTRSDLAYVTEGSSPLTRGKRVGGETDCSALGLIPTHAGKTIRSTRDREHGEAHPHSRGENSPWFHARVSHAGSSPLTRGKRTKALCAGYTRGLIPTHAGKTAARAGRHARRGAHPHSRGENSKLQAALSEGRGSSPLTRGKR